MIVDEVLYGRIVCLLVCLFVCLFVRLRETATAIVLELSNKISTGSMIMPNGSVIMSNHYLADRKQYQDQDQDEASRPRPRLSKYGLGSRDQDPGLENSMSGLMTQGLCLLICNELDRNPHREANECGELLLSSDTSERRQTNWRLKASPSEYWRSVSWLALRGNVMLSAHFSETRQCRIAIKATSWWHYRVQHSRSANVS